MAAPLVAEALEGAGVSGPRSGAGALPKVDMPGLTVPPT